MNKERASKCIHSFGCWDNERNSFDIHVTRDIVIS